MAAYGADTAGRATLNGGVVGRTLADYRVGLDPLSVRMLGSVRGIGTGGRIYCTFTIYPSGLVPLAAPLT